MALLEFFLNNKHRPMNRWLHYLPLYERHLEKLVGQEVTLLEIGVGGGGSLQMWKWFFGPKARIVGIDENPQCAFEEEQIEVVIGDQGDTDLLTATAERFGGFDVVIDDGKHRFKWQMLSFDALYRYARHFYIVEDLHTAYMPQYGGGVKDQQFMGFAKQKVDQLTAWHRNAMTVDEFTRTTVGVHFYDSLCIFEKGTVGTPEARTIGWE